MKELPSPYGDCESSEEYVQSKCLAECQAYYVIDNCNCKDLHMPGDNTDERDIQSVFQVHSEWTIFAKTVPS